MKNKILTYIANELINTHKMMEKSFCKEDAKMREYTKGRIAQLELVWYELTGEWLEDHYQEYKEN